MGEAAGLEKEIKRLNDYLEKNLKSSKYVIYSANPFKFIFYNFLAGIFHSIGSVIGTVIILAVSGWFLIQVLGKVDLSKSVSDWLNQVREQSIENLNPGGVRKPSSLEFNLKPEK